MSNARAQFNAEEEFARKALRAKVGGGLGRKQHSTALCYHARLMLRTTLILYCKRAALHHVRTAHPIHSLITIGPPSSSTLSEKGLSDEAARALASGLISARRRGSARLPGTYPCLESREPDRFRLRMGSTLEKRSGSVHTTPRMCLAPPLFCARGGFSGNAEDTAGHSSS